MKWNAWGDPAAAKPLSDGITALLRQALGVAESAVPAVSLENVRLRPSTLSPADRAALAAIVGGPNLRRRRPRPTAARRRQVHAGSVAAQDNRSRRTHPMPS